jgi:hypothetical protein
MPDHKVEPESVRMAVTEIVRLETHNNANKVNVVCRGEGKG